MELVQVDLVLVLLYPQLADLDEVSGHLLLDEEVLAEPHVLVMPELDRRAATLSEQGLADLFEPRRQPRFQNVVDEVYLLRKDVALALH